MKVRYFIRNLALQQILQEGHSGVEEEGSGVRVLVLQTLYVLNTVRSHTTVPEQFVTGLHLRFRSKL